MTHETLHDLPAWRAALARHPVVMLFKHSPTCPVSAAALREWEAFCRACPDLPTLFVDVLADRAVARGLAEECGVRHQSPQAILFRGGRHVWDASHGSITADSLQRAAGA
ncbi:MAG: bacillithiol system redox-active protein YtxJ [Planctomycetes bacterium]|nr:bacillithiol system redox-active protein YtxJ [Planctomycetota bacterium]